MTDTPIFDQSLYEASYKALTENSVPVNTADRASQVIASDDPDQENFGRSALDQQNVNDAMTWYWAKKADEELPKK